MIRLRPANLNRLTVHAADLARTAVGLLSRWLDSLELVTR